MTLERPLRVCLWLGVSADSKEQDREPQRADLEQVCEQQGWMIVKVYEVEDSAFGKKPRQQFQAMLEDVRKGKFDILVVWSLNRFSREGEWSVSRIMAALQDWNVRFYSYNEPFLDTTGPFAEFLIPLFAWLAGQESVKKGKPIGRPVVVDSVDTELVVRLRNDGKSWAQIAEVHPRVRSASGKRIRPSVGSIRRAFAAACIGEDEEIS